MIQKVCFACRASCLQSPGLRNVHKVLLWSKYSQRSPPSTPPSQKPSRSNATSTINTASHSASLPSTPPSSSWANCNNSSCHHYSAAQSREKLPLARTIVELAIHVLATHVVVVPLRVRQERDLHRTATQVDLQGAAGIKVGPRTLHEEVAGNPFNWKYSQIDGIYTGSTGCKACLIIWGHRAGYIAGIGAAAC